jgi:uncharacterized protein YqgV (UPF0045/DUF77 family)
LPVPPAEITAEFTIHPFTEGRIEPHVRAGIDAARASGLAVEVGPFGTGLSGDRSDVLDALRAVVEAAVDAGARSVHIKVESPETRSS